MAKNKIDAGGDVMVKSKSMLVNAGDDKIVSLVNSDVQTKEENVRTYNASATNIDVDKLVNSAIKQFDTSKEREWMQTGEKYYNNESDIDNKKRYDHCGIHGKENTRLSNAKIHRAFMRKLTRQKVNYAFGEPFSISTDNEAYKKILEEEYFEKGFYRLIQTLGVNAVKQGLNWLNPYYDETGKLCYRRVPGDQVKPFWSDIDHLELQCVIHYYCVDVYVGDDVNDTFYADYYSHSGVIHYVKNADGIYERQSEQPYEEGNFLLPTPQTEEVKDKDGNIVEVIYKLDADGNIIFENEPYVWDRIPWIPFKYNSDEKSLIVFIKSLIDMYERLLSLDLDIIIDIPDNIKVIKGYSGANLEDLTDNIAKYRAVLIDGDGSMESLETKFDVTSSEKLLNILRKDIYEDGAGVDTQTENTGDQSGTALKFLYNDLDLDCREFIAEFKLALEELMFFIDYDIQLKHEADYSQEEVTFNFKTSGIINELELIEMINASRDMIPDKFLLPKHPFVEDVTEVEQAIEEQKAEEEAEMQKTLNAMNGAGNTGGNIPANNQVNNPTTQNTGNNANAVKNAINNPKADMNK